MDIGEVLAAADAAFAVTGADTPGWPDPHPDHVVAADEYSRCLDPGKYRILAARVAAWAQTVADLGLATVRHESYDPAAWAPPDRSERDGRTVTLIPVEPGALPLRIGLFEFDGIRDGITVVGVGAPAVAVHDAPGCGCDACDDGSAMLLEKLDEVLGGVLAGTFVRVEGVGCVITSPQPRGWSGSGWGLPGEAAVKTMLAAARGGRPAPGVLRGAPWWGVG